MQAFSAAAQFARCLRPTQQQLAQDGFVASAQVQHFGEAMFILGRARVAQESGHAFHAKRSAGIAHGFFVELHDWIAVRFLIARIDQRV